MSGVRIVVCHRSRLFGETLADSLKDHSRNWECIPINPAANHEARSRLVPRGTVDLLILDPTIRFELEKSLIETIGRHHPQCRLMLMVSEVALNRIVPLLKHRCEGWLFDQASIHDVVTAVETVLQGGQFCSPEIACAVLHDFQAATGSKKKPSQSTETNITDREREILTLIDRDRLTNKEIGDILHLDVSTVKRHVHNASKKLGVKNRRDAARVAARQLLQPDSESDGNPGAASRRTA